MDNDIEQIAPEHRTAYVLDQLAEYKSPPYYMEKREMSESTMYLFIDKNQLINKKSKRLWEWEPIKERGYYAFTMKRNSRLYDQEDVIMMSGYSKYLLECAAMLRNP